MENSTQPTSSSPLPEPVTPTTPSVNPTTPTPIPENPIPVTPVTPSPIVETPAPISPVPPIPEPTQLTPPAPVPTQPEVVQPVPVEQPIVPQPTVPPLPVTPTVTKSVDTYVPLTEKATKSKKTLFLVIALLILVAAIAIAAFLLLSKNTPPASNTDVITPTPIVSSPTSTVSSPVTSNTNLTPEEQMNEGNVQGTMSTFTSRIFNWTFEYPKSLGVASSTTSNFSYTAGVECYTENISFSDNPNIIVGASAGHCEGGSGGEVNASGVTAIDGKSYFVSSVQNNDGTYRISVKGGVDNSSTYPRGVEGVYMEASSQANLDLGTTILGQIIKNSRVDLTTLKTQDFDKVSTH